MLFKVRHNNGDDFLSGSWVNKDGTKKSLGSSDFKVKETAYSTVRGKRFLLNGKFLFLAMTL